MYISAKTKIALFLIFFSPSKAYIINFTNLITSDALKSSKKVNINNFSGSVSIVHKYGSIFIDPRDSRSILNYDYERHVLDVIALVWPSRFSINGQKSSFEIHFVYKEDGDSPEVVVVLPVRKSLKKNEKESALLKNVILRVPNTENMLVRMSKLDITSTIPSVFQAIIYKSFSGRRYFYIKGYAYLDQSLTRKIKRLLSDNYRVNKGRVSDELYIVQGEAS